MKSEFSQMAILNKELIKHNLFTLLDYSGLSDISFANVLGVSDKQIKRIKKDTAEFTIDNINMACVFFHKSFASVNNKKIKVNSNFRDSLLEIHKNNSEFNTLLLLRPTITYAINFILLQDKNFIDRQLEVQEIKALFKSKGWIFTSSYISLAMKRNRDAVNIKSHPTKNRKFVYSKKQ